MTMPEYSLEDITDDAARLNILLDMTFDLAVETGPSRFASQELYVKWIARNLGALMYVTRDLSEKIVNGLDALPPMEPKASRSDAI